MRVLDRLFFVGAAGLLAPVLAVATAGAQLASDGCVNGEPANPAAMRPPARFSPIGPMAAVAS